MSDVRLVFLGIGVGFFLFILAVAVRTTIVKYRPPQEYVVQCQSPFAPQRIWKTGKRVYWENPVFITTDRTAVLLPLPGDSCELVPLASIEKPE